MADLGDLNEPIPEKSLAENPNHPMVQTIIYLYSLEPPFYGHLNWASREKVVDRLDAVGPFAAALDVILRNIDSKRPDRQTEDFQVYRGLNMPMNEIESYIYMAQNLKECEKEWEAKNARKS